MKCAACGHDPELAARRPAPASALACDRAFDVVQAFGGGRLWSWLNLNDTQRAALDALATALAQVPGELGTALGGHHTPTPD